MRMTEYPEASVVASSDVLIIDGQDGNRKLPASKALEPLLKHGTSTNGHRVIPECNFLGNTVTEAQARAIYDGTFEGLHVGDYWTMSGQNWRIWDFDYWFGSTVASGGNIHHVVILPDEKLYDYVMNDTDTTSGGYVGSKMYTTGLNSAKATINSIFGDLVYTHKEYFSNSVSSSGFVNGSAILDSTIEIPSETQLYGCRLNSSSMPSPSTVPIDYDNGRHQLLLGQLMPEYVTLSYSVWIRDVVSATRFASVVGTGNSFHSGASSSRGVRPVFGIKGRAGS